VRGRGGEKESKKGRTREDIGRYTYPKKLPKVVFY
jgi:hypothetical protein